MVNDSIKNLPSVEIVSLKIEDFLSMQEKDLELLALQTDSDLNSLLRLQDNIKKGGM